MTHAAGIGKTLADWIMDGKPSFPESVLKHGKLIGKSEADILAQVDVRRFGKANNAKQWGGVELTNRISVVYEGRCSLPDFAGVKSKL